MSKQSENKSSSEYSEGGGAVPRKDAALTLPEARNSLADPEVRDRLARLGRTYDGAGIIVIGEPPDPRRVEFHELAKAPEGALIAKLRSGDLKAAGLPADSNMQVDAPMPEIDPSFWDLFRPDFGRSALVDEVGKIRISQVRVLFPRITLSDDGRLLSVDGRTFDVSGKQQMRCIEFLRDAYVKGENWTHKAAILSHAGSKSLELRDIFKNKRDWREFIFGNGKSEYTIDPDLRPPAVNRTESQ